MKLSTRENITINEHQNSVDSYYRSFLKAWRKKYKSYCSRMPSTCLNIKFEIKDNISSKIVKTAENRKKDK